MLKCVKIFSHTPLNTFIQNDVTIFNNVFSSDVKDKQNNAAKLDFVRKLDQIHKHNTFFRFKQYKVIFFEENSEIHKCKKHL